MKFNEQVTVENYIIKFIKDKLGLNKKGLTQDLLSGKVRTNI